MFVQHPIETKENNFEQLANPHFLSSAGRGRLGGVLVDCENASGPVPLVRSTTAYPTASCFLTDVHYALIAKIRSKVPEARFNNAMVEVYDPTCRTMKFHTDQTLDLEEDSYICLFTCYNHAAPPRDMLRTLQIQNKTSPEQLTQLTLHHNSIVVFSTRANREHRHRIVLCNARPPMGAPPVLWLGLTLRLSKTFVQFEDRCVPRFVATGAPLRLASEKERQQFFRLKSLENQMEEEAVGGDPPALTFDFTLSPGDLLPPRRV